MPPRLHHTRDTEADLTQGLFTPSLETMLQEVAAATAAIDAYRARSQHNSVQQHVPTPAMDMLEEVATATEAIDAMQALRARLN